MYLSFVILSLEETTQCHISHRKFGHFVSENVNRKYNIIYCKN